MSPTPRTKSACVLSIFVFLFCSQIIAAETRIGRIEKIDGEAEFDPFGTGAFVPAHEEDALYESSVVRVLQGAVTVSVRDRRIALPSGVDVSISSLIASDRTKNRYGWLPRIMGVVKQLFSVEPEELEAYQYGGRAAEASSDGPVWVLDDEDDDVLFDEAVGLIGDEEYLQALEVLSRLEDTPTSALPGEVNWLRGHALYELQLYEPAASSFAAAGVPAAESPAADFYPSLLLEWATSELFLGNAERSVDLLARFLETAGDEMRPYTLALYATALRDAGDEEKARDVLSRALREYRDTDAYSILDAVDDTL